jgi:hypothetical protein
MGVKRTPLLAVMAIAVGCSNSPSLQSSPSASPSTRGNATATAPAAVGRGTPFVAALTRVERQPGWQMRPLDGSAALAWKDVLVGPALFQLAGGRRIRVVAHTRGGNTCMQFIKTPQDRRLVTLEPNATDAQVRRAAWFSGPCVIIGSLRSPDHLLWYRVIKVSPEHHAEIGRITATDEKTVTVEDGLTWPVDATRSFTCGRYSASIADAVAHWSPMAVLDVSTRQVVRVDCYFRL